MNYGTKKPLAERERALENAFFARVDADLLKKMRNQLSEEKDLEKLAADTGVHNHEVLKELLELEITPETLMALWLVPLVQVAWADGHVSREERNAVLDALGKHGYSAETPAWHLLESWLEHAPSGDVVMAWRDYARELIDSSSEKRRALLHFELLKRAREVAQAAGGVLGMGRVSKAEQAVIEQIEKATAL